MKFIYLFYVSKNYVMSAIEQVWYIRTIKHWKQEILKINKK